MIKRLRNSLSQLRWKLTLSYTAVAVGTLLIMLLVLAILVLSTFLLPGDVLTPDVWLNATDDQVVPIFRALLTNLPPDLDQINSFLRSAASIDAAISGRELFQAGRIQFLVKAAAEVDYLLVDPEGTLLGSSSPELVSRGFVGKPLDPDRVPGLAGPLEAALKGVVDPDQIFVTVRPDEEYLWAMPILGTGDTAGEVLGALVVRVDSVPTQGDLTPIALTLVARGLLIFVLGAAAIGGIFGSLTAEGMVSRFGRLWSATEAWSRGDFTQYVHDPSSDEIGQLASRLNTMAAQLKDLLQERQQIAVSEERNRLARDLHDSAKQQALAASFQLGTALTLLDTDRQAAKRHLQEADSLVDSVRLELTDLIHELRPPSTPRVDLEEVIDEYVIGWAHQNDIRAEVTVVMREPLPLKVDQAIYRVLQEALANIARHSNASQVTVTLDQGGSAVTLTVADNGVGFDTGGQYNGMGLHSMRERVESVKGSFDIRSDLGQGTVITATIALDRGNGE